MTVREDNSRGEKYGDRNKIGFSVRGGSGGGSSFDRDRGNDSWRRGNGDKYNHRNCGAAVSHGGKTVAVIETELIAVIETEGMAMTDTEVMAVINTEIMVVIETAVTVVIEIGDMLTAIEDFIMIMVTGRTGIGGMEVVVIMVNTMVVAEDTEMTLATKEIEGEVGIMKGEGS